MPPGIIESFPILYHYDQASFPHREDVTTSPLRFTWEYENPRYYSDSKEYSQRNIPVAVLSGGPVAPLPSDMRDRPKGYRLLREFAAYEGIYSSRTTVAVYPPEPGTPAQEEIR